MTLERLLSKDIPLAEAAAAFQKLKLGTGYAPPDETGELEGQFDATPEEVIKLLGEMVNNEFKTMLAYKTYAESLRGTEREGISEEFEEHAEQEVEHAEFLMKRMSVLGGAIQLEDIPAPPASTDPVDIIKTMIRMEQEGLAKWKVLHSICGENPTKFKVEEFMTNEQHHLDELWQMLPYEARASVGTGNPEANTLPAQPSPASGPPDEGAQPNPDLGQAKAASAMTPEEKLAAFKEKLGFGFGGAMGRVGGIGSSLRSAVSKAPIPKAAPSALSVTKPIMHQGATIPGVPAHVLQGAGMMPASTGGIQTAPMLGHAQAGLEAAKMRGPVANAAMQGQQALSNAGQAVGGAVDKAKGFFGNLGASIKNKFQGATGRMQDAYAGGKMVTASAKDQSPAEKGKERAEASLSAKAHTHEGTRGEQYGDVIGRVLGAAGGAAVGAKLGPDGKKMLSGLGSAALGQHLGGKTGKLLGKELDTRKNKKAGVKLSFEDALNMLAQEQEAEAAAEQNAAQYYAEKARQVAAEKSQMEQQLQQAMQESQMKDQQLQMTQQTIQQATDSSTKALMQAVQANSEAITNRQLAADTTISMDKLRQSLRELADGGGSPGGPGDITGGVGQAQGAQAASGSSGPAGNGSSGGGVVGGDAQPGGKQEGPANQAETPSSGPGAAPPDGESQNEGRSESPEKSDASPATESGTGAPGGGEGGQGKVSIKVGSFMDAAKGVGKMGLGFIKERGPYALAGAALAGGAKAMSNMEGPGKAQQKAHELEGQQDGSFGQAMALAKAQAEASLREVSANHPIASTAASALGGAAMGAMAGPRIGGRLSNIGKNLRELAG